MIDMHCPRCGRVMQYVEDMHETDYPESEPGVIRDDMTWWCEPCDVRVHAMEKYERVSRVIEVLGLEDDISWGDGDGTE